MPKLKLAPIADIVYAVVRSIPRGRVMTYGEVARKAGVKSARLVGRLLHNNPDPMTIPCHRVVFADGRLAPAFAFGGAEEQEKRLKNEGVRIKNGRVKIADSKF